MKRDLFDSRLLKEILVMIKRVECGQRREGA